MSDDADPTPDVVPVYSVRDRGGAEPVPPVVSLHLYGVSGAGIPRALRRMATDRSRVRRLPGLTFAKLLGTGTGLTFTLRDANPRLWGVLACWRDDEGPRRYEASPVHRAWSQDAYEQARFLLRPLASRGTWAGRTPFGDPLPHRWDGTVASITRARISPRATTTFWRAAPPVTHDLHAVDGLLLAMGIGEAPLGLQGTFSLWRSHADLTEFAHRRAPHQEVMRRTHDESWYDEELFARFAVVAADGVVGGRSVGLGRDRRP